MQARRAYYLVKNSYPPKLVNIASQIELECAAAEQLQYMHGLL